MMSSFQTCQGAVLMEQMSAKGYIKDGKLDGDRFDALPAKFWTEGLPIADFHSAWDAPWLCHSQLPG